MRIERGRGRPRRRAANTQLRLLLGRFWRKRIHRRLRRHSKDLWTESITVDTLTGPIEVKVLHDLQKKWGGTCGSVLWASSTALVGWLCARQSRLDLFIGQTVLELGCGLGFIGTVMHKMGARDVLVTDLPKQLPIVRRNLVANADRTGHPTAGTRLRCCGYAWGGRPRTVFRRAWNLVVACDVVYDKECVDDLVHSLRSLLLGICSADGTSTNGGRNGAAPNKTATPKTTVLLALPDRSEFGFHLRTAHGELVPKLDYELVLHRLQKQLNGRLRIKMLDAISSEDAETAGSTIDVLLLSMCDGSADPPDAAPEFDAVRERAQCRANREAESRLPSSSSSSNSNSTEGRGDSELACISRDPRYKVLQN